MATGLTQLLGVGGEPVEVRIRKWIQEGWGLEESAGATRSLKLWRESGVSGGTRGKR